MKVKALVAFKTKLFKPCRKLLKIFKLKLRKPLFIRSVRPCSGNTKSRKSHPKNHVSALLSGFRRLTVSKKMDRLMELRSISEAGTERMQQQQPLYLSPITPAYVKAAMPSNKRDGLDTSGNEELEDACRSFENYLVETIVEEGKVGDLTDVEELLYCWKNLKCPVFIDLVCRFYGELCKDLFSAEDDEDSNISTP